VNVLLAVLLLPAILAMVVWQDVSLSFRTLMQPGLLGLLVFLLSANVSLAVFNMIPAFPLDGGRVFRAALGFFFDYTKATSIAVTVGRVLAVGLGIVALVTGQFFLAIIALFIFMVGGQEAQAVAARAVLRTAQAGQALSSRSVALSPHATVGQAASLVMSNNQPNFAVLDPVSGELMGVATSSSVIQAMRRGLSYNQVTEIMQHARSIPKVALNASLDEVQEKLVQTSSRVAAVYDGLHFRGLISLDDIYRAFNFISRTSASPSPRRVGWDVAG
jgi:hypothetical protein